MRYHLENIAKVREADIEISGISVVAGDNATGKSTISRGLMALFSLSTNMSELIQYERAASVAMFVKENAKVVDSELEVWNMPRPYALGAWRILMNDDFWRDEQEFLSWIEKYFGLESDSKVRIGWCSGRMAERPGFGEFFSRVRQKVRDVMASPSAEYERHVCVKVLNTAYDSQWRNILAGSADYSIRLSEDAREWAVCSAGGNVVNVALDRSQIFPSVFYLEPIHLLEMAERREANGRYVAGASDSVRMIAAEPPTDLTLEMQRNLDDARHVLDGIAGVIHGRLRQRKDKIVFEEAGTSEGRDVSIINMASGMKSMASIIRVIENGTLQRGGLLVIDEPESNLHPQWQVDFARFLVLLHRDLGIRLLLTTHSPYFLKAIQTYSDLAGVGPQCRYYQMLPDEGLGGFRSHDRTLNARPIFESMAEPYARLRYGENHA